MVDGRLLATINGKQSAEWFFKSMQIGDDIHTYTVVPVNEQDTTEILSTDEELFDIQPVRPW